MEHAELSGAGPTVPVLLKANPSLNRAPRRVFGPMPQPTSSVTEAPANAVSPPSAEAPEAELKPFATDSSLAAASAADGNLVPGEHSATNSRVRCAFLH